MDIIDLLQILVIGLTFGGVYALMASGLTLTFGVMKIVNLAHPALIIGAAYLSYVLSREFGIDPLLSIVINGPVMFLVGMLIYKLFLSRDVDNPRYFETTVLSTFALALILEGALGTIFTNTNRTLNPSYATQAIFIGDIFLSRAQLYATGISIVAISGLWLFLKYTRTGYAIRATSQNRNAAQTIGVDVERISLITFGIGTGLAGVSGAILSFLFSFFPNGHWEWISILLALIVLGGMGELLGTIIGAILLAVAASFVSSYIGPTWSPLTFYLSLFVVLLIRPQGILGKREELA